MFRKILTLHHVHDTVTVREGDESLTLRIDEDAMILARRIMGAANDVNTSEKDGDKMQKAAMNFAIAMFGEEQANKLLDFYGGNEYAVLEICGAYFRDSLGKQITKQQKKLK